MTTGISERRIGINAEMRTFCAMRSVPITTVIILLCVTIAALA
jgi:hypothetical protein